MTSSFFVAIYCAFGKYDVVYFDAEGACAMLWIPKLFSKRCICTVHRTAVIIGIVFEGFTGSELRATCWKL